MVAGIILQILPKMTPYPMRGHRLLHPSHHAIVQHNANLCVNIHTYMHFFMRSFTHAAFTHLTAMNYPK